MSPASGIAEYELEATTVILHLGGREFSTWGYKEGLTGPETRIKEGHTLRAAVVNLLPEYTTTRWHGVPLPNEMDGVPDVSPRSQWVRASRTSSWPKTLAELHLPKSRGLVRRILEDGAEDGPVTMKLHRPQARRPQA